MKDDNLRLKTILYGGLIGLFVGLASALIKVRRAEEKGQTISFSSKDSVRLGSAIFDLISRLS
ncbi:hypothetical protein BEQ56_11400 [Anaerolineaceae bacterium oral taxon 439]|nr:hypothetical protein BEQ56_11400 [Anaerolineaceae bacterium oral taxon 439]